MKISKTQSSTVSAILALSLLLGIGIVFSATAQAQYQIDRDVQGGRNDNSQQNQRGRNWERYGNYGGSVELRETALNAGYDEGSRLGRIDVNSRNRSDYHNQSAYQEGTKDYRRRLGDRELYRRYFQEAFESAYNAEGYTQDRRNDRNENADRNRGGRNWDGYGNYGGSFQLRQTALNAGFNEGLKQGRDDRNSRDSSDYHNRNAYQRATEDYNSNDGDRELYRRYYREAYENGYGAGTTVVEVNVQTNDQNRGDNNDRRRGGRNWDGYGNYGGSFQLRQTALNAGFNEGLKQGRDDRNSHNRSDFHNRNAYRKATDDYNSRDGDRSLYQRYYREAYENGYGAGAAGN